MEFANNAERVSHIEGIISDVEEGKFATIKQVNELMGPLVNDGSMKVGEGSSSPELKSARERLRTACGKQGLLEFFV